MAHGGFALIFGLPEAPTILFIVALVIVIGFLLLRSAWRVQGVEIEGLRDALTRQAEQHRRDIEALNQRMDKAIEDADKHRSLKHAAQQHLTRSIASVDLASTLVEQAMVALNLCECDELEIIKKTLAPIVSLFDRIRADNLALLPNQESI